MTHPPDTSTVARHRAAVLAGRTGDLALARTGCADPDARVRAGALGSLARLGALDDATLRDALADPDPIVRRRALTLAIDRPTIALDALLQDPDATVVEHAAWACGERAASDAIVARLVVLAREHADSLVREAAVAALGSLGDERGLDAILAGCTDVATVRRRAVLALAPFDGPAVREALATARADRDWQVRQSAEDLAAIVGLDDPLDDDPLDDAD